MKKLLLISLFSGKVKIDVLFVAIVIIFGVFGYLADFSIFVVSIMFHELSHIIGAKGYGISLESIHVLPFGCRQYFSKVDGMTYSQEIVISILGPITNLFIAAVILLCNIKLNTLLGLSKAIEINLILAAINLFPALPLDGGRIFRAVLSKVFKRTTANKVVSMIGMIFGAALLILGLYTSIIGKFIIILYIFGLFILLGAIREYSDSRYKIVNGLTQNNNGKRAVMNIKRVALNKHCALKTAVREFESGKYNSVLVIDDDLSIIYELNEKQVLNAMMAHGQNVTCFSAVKAYI